ncbi:MULTISPECIES: TolC family outer membrane protein [Thioclava]|uniref:TolC family outer membrane protein n=1 Tax=Thioclava litoralis TaxID=3076557 RepID=A0ABZ1E4Q8_9RHOB|nr:TolC family outer membrane protein [Thioclava sp. FTW29]
MLKSLLLATGITGFMVAGSVTAQAETLADAMISAYKTSNLLEQNRATLRAADEGVAQAVAALRPVVQWTASYGWTKSEGVSSLTGRDVTSEGSSATTALSASITLFDFGRNRLTISSQKEAVLATRETLRSIEQQVLLATVQAYSDVKSAQEQVAINQNSVRVLQEELNATNDRFDVGEVTRTDVSLAEAQLASARASLVSAQGSLETARESYKASTGHYPGKLAPLPPAPNLPKSRDEASSTAQRNHPAIKSLQHSVAMSEIAVKSAKAEKLPEITGSVSLSNDEGGYVGQAASIGMTQTIYSGGTLDSAYRQAVASRDSSRAELRQEAVDVVQAVLTSYASIDVYRAQIRAYDEQIRAAQVAYDGVKEEATLGARTTLDVLDAEQDLLDARANRITAEADLQVAYYQLLSNMGLLTVENLKLGIPTYDPAAYYNAVHNAPLTSIRGEKLDKVLRAIGKQ